MHFVTPAYSNDERVVIKERGKEDTICCGVGCVLEFWKGQAKRDREMGKRERSSLPQQGTISGNFGKRVRLYNGVDTYT